MKYKILIFFLAVKWTFRINLGDRVWYKNKKCVVMNRVKGWTLLSDDNNLFNVNKKECRKVFSIENYVHSFWFAIRYYNTCWLETWQRYGIEDWMKKCNIW